MSLNEQNLVDCSRTAGNAGYDSRCMKNALEYTKQIVVWTKMSVILNGMFMYE